jgi:hypothetical protein
LRKRIIMISFLTIFIGLTILWYINFPAYENLAENRINKYMEAQKVDKNIGFQKKSIKDFTTGRWLIVYKFENEKTMNYEYDYDKSEDKVLLIVYKSASNRMDGGTGIDDGMNYPSIEKNGWTKFNKHGNVIFK